MIILFQSLASELYGTTKNTFLWTLAFAAVWAGFKIFAKWNSGQEITPLIFAWLAGMIIGLLFFKLIDVYILGGAYNNSNPDGLMNQATGSSYKIAMYSGLIVAIVQLIRIFKKSADGEDTVSLVWQWASSIVFLFSFAYIIEAIL